MTDVCTCRTIALSGWDTVQQAVNPTCPLHATYTAAEVKVLTEAALRLGRKEAGEEIAAACVKVRDLDAEAVDVDGDRSYALAGVTIGLTMAAKFALRIASQPSGAASDAISGASEMVGGSKEPPRRDVTYPVDDDHPKGCLCPSCAKEPS